MSKRAKNIGTGIPGYITVVCMAIVILLLMVSGCIAETNEQGETTYKADPCTVKKVEQSVEAGISLLGILSVFLPVLIPVATGAAGIYGTYKKVKPKLDVARTEANLYHTSTHTLVAVIEEIKLKQPELWKKLKPFLEDSKMGKNIENVILALRGKPPKE